jgi:hypothetical protein
MLRPIAALFAIFTLAGASSALASEDSVTMPDAARVSRYERLEIAAGQEPKSHSRPHGAALRKAERAARQPREKTVTFSARAGNFYFHDASVRLLTDRDGDGYHSEFRVRFDADSLVGTTRVYAKLYLRRFGESEWFLYRETDDFWLEGVDDRDDYIVTTTLDDGYATDDYDILIDLYESGFSGIVATIGPYDTNALAYVPLEEVGLDVPIELPGFSIGKVSTTLLIDDDGDGHYSQFRVAFDPDSDVGSHYVYARVWVRPRGGSWIEEHVTDDFVVDPHGSQDTYAFTADWLSGYPTAYYDLQIDLFDAATNLLVASAGSERPEFAQIPLEDASRDVRPNPPAGGGGGSNTSRESGGGGAFSLFGLFALLAGARRLKRRS